MVSEWHRVCFYEVFQQVDTLRGTRVPGPKAKSPETKSQPFVQLTNFCVCFGKLA